MGDEGVAVVSWEIGGERDESGDWREREKRKSEGVHPLTQGCFCSTACMGKCVLPQNYEFLLTFFSLFNVSDFAKKYNNVQNSFKQTTICLKTL